MLSEGDGQNEAGSEYPGTHAQNEVMSNGFAFRAMTILVVVAYT